MRVELVVVPIVDGFTLVVDAECVGSHRVGEVDGTTFGVCGYIRRLAPGLMPEEKGITRCLPLSEAAAGLASEAVADRARKKIAADVGEEGKLFHARIVPRKV